MGGPNGSGKSSLIRSGQLDRWMPERLRALSPDDIVLDLRKRHPDWSEAQLLLKAQETSDGLVDDAIANRRSVMVETVLSSSKFERPVTTALESGFEFGFVFVTVLYPEVNIARVRERVELGGHDVPEDRIRARRQRAHAALPWFADRATIGLVFDNSQAAPRLLAEKQRDQPAWAILAPDRLRQLGLKLSSSREA